MGTVATNRWLVQYIEKYSDTLSQQEKLQLQLDTMIAPLTRVFKSRDMVGLHRYLLESGLFYPDKNITEELEIMKSSQLWRTVQNEYLTLKKAWCGPKAKIFLYPLEERNELIMKELGGKMGLGFPDKIFLFVTGRLEESELKALVTHEYHHVCRLQSLDMPHDKVTLLDSLIIEGLAEVAVQERMGYRCVANWAKRYSEEEAKQIWYRFFINNKEIKGKEQHLPFLYGTDIIPPWGGYSVGFHIVNTAIKNDKELVTNELLQLSAKEILSISSFSS
ncbi:DUF2268 domain-containing protein [Bacillus sp. FJAT-45350]|uniref:DUF2268 domain-containing protein n=1 Tax=Bacillus sp. FJAT-45350 TaxID=2011014 RepID=UPI0015C89BE3|nr:DUF2268 domain-containing putative Zn-dependent protease [Bacillus sp. FJAT-45350]